MYIFSVIMHLAFCFTLTHVFVCINKLWKSITFLPPPHTSFVKKKRIQTKKTTNKAIKTTHFRHVSSISLFFCLGKQARKSPDWSQWMASLLFGHWFRSGLQNYLWLAIIYYRRKMAFIWLFAYGFILLFTFPSAFGLVLCFSFLLVV